MTPQPPQTYQLRDYQIDTIQQVFRHWGWGEHRVMVQLPTGGGKTIIFCALANEFTKKSEPVLVIAHREELITQAASKLEAVTLTSPGIIKAGYKPNPDSLIQVASIQTLIRRNPPKASFVIFDEAHHCHSRTYATVFKHYAEQGSYILGCTATPMRTDGRGLRWLYSGVEGFESLIVGPTVNELIAADYLIPFKLYAPGRIINASSAGLKTTAGDYNKAQLEDFVKKTLVIGDVIETWKKHAAGRRTVLFAVSVDHSSELATAFLKAGISAAHLDGDTPLGQRQQILADFENGKILVLCQHSIVTEGVDIPKIEAVQFTRPTKSLTIWFQAIGRSLRPSPGKPHAVVIDHTDTHLNLPYPDNDIPWSLDPISLKPGQGVLNCPKCHHVFRPTGLERERNLATCPACQVKFIFVCKPRDKKGIEPLEILEVCDAEFYEVIPEYNVLKLAAVQQIINLQEEKGYQKGWVYHQLVKMPQLHLGINDWQEVGRRLGYKPGWAWHKWQSVQELYGLDRA
ncbi:MAG: DEAD/DEAH box helicase [Hassallia sp. WJT32-NPBG1]|nr:DEAD/DEAH box helicase [Hassallia sp. WJT32-NPBG1]